MADLLNAVFHSFWTFCGTVILIAVISNAIVRIVTASTARHAIKAAAKLLKAKPQ